MTEYSRLGIGSEFEWVQDLVSYYRYQKTKPPSEILNQMIKITKVSSLSDAAIEFQRLREIYQAHKDINAGLLQIINS
jgi:hypothetical protein